MRKKGFTLIELLAVIVILAIIALIAVPAIINLVSDSKEESIKRSTELYIDAVEQTLMNQNLDDDFNLELCDVTNDGNLKCYVGEKTVDISVDFNGQAPTQGTIEARNGTVIRIYNLELQGSYFNYTSSTVSDNGEKIIEKGTEKFEEPICIASTSSNKTTGKIPTGNYTTGDEYICKVNDTTRHHFFVLSTETGTEYVNLIINRNITDEGAYSDVENLGLTDWNNTNKGTLNVNAPKNLKQGPVIAFNYLSQATSSWTNIPDLVINYTNEQDTYSGYRSITSTGEVTTITNSDGGSQATYNNLKARLPKYSELSSIGCTVTNILDGNPACPLYIVDYLNEANNVVEGKTTIHGIYGYWIMSSDIFYYLAEALQPGQSSLVYKAAVPTLTVESSNYFGIRPVITLKKETLK